MYIVIFGFFTPYFPLISDEWPPYATYVAIEIAEFIEDSYSDDEDSAPHRLGESVYKYAFMLIYVEVFSTFVSII